MKECVKLAIQGTSITTTKKNVVVAGKPNKIEFRGKIRSLEGFLEKQMFKMILLSALCEKQLTSVLLLGLESVI